MLTIVREPAIIWAMPRQPKLKVYRTSIGFHDAYVAAPSQKAALKAWGSDADLFARGVAELVTDAALTGEPLDKPGTVIRRARGTTADYLAALAKDASARPPVRRDGEHEDEGPPPRRRRSSQPPPRPNAATPPAKPAPAKAKPAPKPRPRPSRAALDKAEQAIERAQARHDDALTDLRRREKALQQQRRDLERRHEEEIERLEAALDEARARHAAALEAWRR